MQIPISEKRVLIALVIIAVYLSLQSIIVKAYEFSLPVNGSNAFIFESVIFVNVSYESNLPSWYSTLLIAVCAATLGIIAYIHYKQQDRFVRMWTLLSIIFFYLSLDESTALHERFTQPLRTIFNTENFLYFAWSIAGAIFVLVVGLFYARFILALPKRTRNLFLLSGTVYVGGALVIDAISAFWFRDDIYNLVYHAIATVEEFCEMLGMSIFLYALLNYLRDNVKSLTLDFGQSIHNTEQTSV